RAFLVMLYDAYQEEEVREEKRVYLKLHPQIAPIKVAILPLSRNEKLTPRPRGPPPPPPALHPPVRRRAVDRPPLPPPRRDRHPPLCHGRLRIARRQRRNDPGARLNGAE